jgi:hypothetical protein
MTAAPYRKVRTLTNRKHDNIQKGIDRRWSQKERELPVFWEITGLNREEQGGDRFDVNCVVSQPVRSRRRRNQARCTVGTLRLELSMNFIRPMTGETAQPTTRPSRDLLRNAVTRRPGSLLTIAQRMRLRVRLDIAGWTANPVDQERHRIVRRYEANDCRKERQRREVEKQLRYAEEARYR